MLNNLAERLGRLTVLDDAAKIALAAVSSNLLAITRGQDLATTGDEPEGLLVVCSGLIARYRSTNEAGRRILAFHGPGDICNLDVSATGPLDFGLTALAESEIALIPNSEITFLREAGNLGKALDLMREADGATARTWLTNLGGRRSTARLAHVMCELAVRMESENDIAKPSRLTQGDWGDTIGVSTVQANRCFKELHDLGLIELRHGKVSIMDRSGLAKLGGFEANQSPY